MSVASARRIALSAVLLAAGCSPSPDQLRATLVKNPQVLYAVIEAHPAEFLAVVNRAAGVAQAAQRGQAIENEAARIEAEFRNPKSPRIEHRAVLGNPKAPVTIVEYSDFQCPFCRRERDVLVQILERYGDRVRLLVKHTPLDEHPQAMPAALMYEAIARQSPAQAYRFYDELFTNPEQLDARGEAFIEMAARRAGADVPRAIADAKSDAVKAVIAADLAEGRQFGFTGTPGFLINGVSLQGAQPLSALEAIIDRHLGAARTR